MKPRVLVVKLITRLDGGRVVVSPAPGVTAIVPETYEGFGTLAATVWERQDRQRNRRRSGSYHEHHDG